MRSTSAAVSRPAAALRPALVVLAALAMVLVAAVPAVAHPTIGLDPTLPTDLTFEATDNIGYRGRFPEHAGTAGGQLSADGTMYYLTDPRGVYVYDVTTPESPELISSLPLYQTTTGAALAQEDPDTDGNVLIVDGSPTPFSASSQLTVVDVSDPEGGLRVLDTVAKTDHTWECVSGLADDGVVRGCAYAYGRTGWIVDLTDPTNAVLLDDTWRAAVGYGDRSNSPYTHDLTEIRPGLVMSAGSTAILMDTTDPANPVELNRIEQPGRFPSLGYHSVEWAQAGEDDHLILGTEIAPSGTTNLAGSDCEGEASVIETWDASAVVEALEDYEDGEITAAEVRAVPFTKIDAFDVSGRGIYLDGNAPAHVLYCAHWMEPHPEYEDGGLMAVSYYDRGTRIVEVDEDGMMSEVGWMVPFQGYSGSVQWVGTSAEGKEVLYISDYTRGMEVIELDADAEATGTYDSEGELVALTSSYTPPARFHGESLVVPAGLLLAAGMVVAERRRRAATA